MSIEVVSIGSSSAGNSYLIMAGGHNIILDVGLTAKRITAGLEAYDIAPESIEAVLITHEHTDHVKSVRAVSRKCSNAVFYASRGTVEHTANFGFVPEDRLHIIESGDCFRVGGTANGDGRGIEVSTFSLSHDASEPVGYAIADDDEKLAVVTDTGIITDEIYDVIRDADILILESNHDEDLLMFGEYPYPLKRRIKGDFGHLSNRTAGETLAQVLSERQKRSAADSGREKRLRIMLAHLSDHNNLPFVARQTVEGILSNQGFEREEDYILDIASKEELTIL